MGDLETQKVSLDLVIHIKDETSDKLIHYVSLSLVIAFNLATAYILWANK